MADHKNADKSHFSDLDGIRGLLANVILLYHLGLDKLISRLSNGLIEESPWGVCVDFFFILSGFVLANSQLKNPKSLRRFFIGRFFRLMPVHFFALTAFYFLYYELVPLSWYEIVANFIGVAVFFGGSLWNVPSWSMHLELYIPLAFYAYKIYINDVRVVIVGFFASLFSQCWTTFNLANGENYMILRGISGILLGYFLYKFCEIIGNKVTINKFGKVALPVLVALYFVAVLFSGKIHIISILIPFLSIVIVSLGRYSNSIFSSYIFAFFGMISYPLYMTHDAIIVICESLINNGSGSYGFKILFIFIAWIFAYLVMKIIEIPGVNLGKRVLAS